MIVSWFPVRAEFVQVPAHPADHSGPLRHQRLPVVSQQPHFPVRAIQPGHRQVRFPLTSAGDGQRVDRVGLATVRAESRT